jgi:hypothetical protein
MKKFFKIQLFALAAFCFVGIAKAQTDQSPMAYLERTYPQLTELFKSELSSYPAHYIFAVDVSGSMKKYESMVANALTPFFQALPNGDRVQVIPFGTEAQTSNLGYAGIIDAGVKSTLCDNIQTLYTNSTYTKEFKMHTNVKSAVDGIAQVIQKNQDYKVNIVVIITDFCNDVKGSGERKFSKDELAAMKKSISAVTGDVYTRFIALELPVDRKAAGYCLDQLREGVFAFDGHNLETASVGNDQNIIKQWFDQLKRDIMITKLKAIVHDANKNSPIKFKAKKDIDGKVSAEIEWKPSKLYPAIQIDSTYVDSSEFVFHNNKENFKTTNESPIIVELGQIKHSEWGFHNLNDDIHLGLKFPVPYDKELTRLEAQKPIPSTVISEEGLVFTFIFTLRTTITIIVLIILYIIGVIHAMARNRKLCFKANVTIYDKNGTQIGDMIRIQKQAPSAIMTFGRGGNNRCNISDAAWQFVVEKKKGNPFLLFVKPRFVWKKSSGYVASGKKQSGVLSDSLRVSCGTAASDITHSIRIKLMQQ